MFFYDFISLSNRQVCLNIDFLFLLYPWFKELVTIKDISPLWTDCKIE